MTYPFSAYIHVIDIDADAALADFRSFYALYDCGTRIDPTIIEGQVMAAQPRTMLSPWGRKPPIIIGATARLAP